MSTIFIKTHNFIQGKKNLIFALFLGLLSILIFLATKINFEEDITKLIPKSEKSIVTNKVLNQVNFADKIVIYTESKNNDINDLTDYANDLVTALKKETFKDYINDIQGQINDTDIKQTLDFVYQNLPLFLEKSDYAQIEGKLKPSVIQEITENNYKTLISPTGIIAKETILKDPLGLSFIGLKKIQKLQGNDNFKLHNGFLVSKDDKELLLFIQPKLASNETDKNTAFVQNLQQVITDLNKKYNAKTSAELYGATIIAVANASQIKNDIQFTVSIAMVLLFLILIFFYKKIYIPIILFIPTLIGGLSAVVFLYFFKGTISAISLGIGSVLLGITLDYSLHISTHFKQNNNIEELYKDVAKPIIMSSITTAITFMCLLFLKSEALRDLGIFASVSVLVSAVFALIVIPLLYKTKIITKSDTLIDKIAGLKYHRNYVLITILVIGLVVSFFFSKNVVFDKDISKMNYQTTAIKNTEQKLDKLTNTHSKSLYLVNYGHSEEEALRQNNITEKVLDSLKNKKQIVSYNSLGTIVLSEKEQSKRIKQWKAFWDNYKKEKVKQNLISYGSSLGFKPSVFHSFYELLDKDFTLVKVNDYQKVKSLFINEFISTKKDFTTVQSLVKISKKEYKDVAQILKKIPNTIIIDRQQTNESFLGNLKTDFNKLLKYSFVALLLVLLFFFKNIELTLITITPIAITWYITIGVMGFLGINFNIFNIIVSTFVFGLGIDYAIFISNGLIKQYTYGTQELKTYKASILLSVITTILGIGVLIFAKHPALQSIAVVSIIGIISAMLISYTVQPFIFGLFISNRAKIGLAPLRFFRTIHSIILNLFFGLGGMILSVFSLIILPLIPISQKLKMNWLHKTMARMVKAVLYGNPLVKKEVINKYNEDFSQPAIVISNHASSLDTLTYGLLTHKLIYLVNDWVYQSPVFGLLARIVGFYPVSNGIDGSLEHLKTKIKQGYSLVVFPEAKRAFTNKIGRFHKGAFLLAKKLKMDILPVYLHGNSEVMPKRDFIIYNGSLTVEVGKRIPFEELRNYGNTDREITKNISKSYKENFLEVRNRIENENYFKGILWSNYDFKIEAIRKKIRSDFKENKSLYHQLNAIIPMKAAVNHIANDYGQMDILLVSKSLDRKITSFIDDKEKRLVAKNCLTNTYRKVNYTNHIKELNFNLPNWLLISTEIHAEALQKMDFSNVKSIVLIKNSNLITFFNQQGFEVRQTEPKFTVLSRI